MPIDQPKLVQIKRTSGWWWSHSAAAARPLHMALRLMGVGLWVLFFCYLASQPLFANEERQETIGVDLLLSLQEEICPETSVVAAQNNELIYFCVVIRNQSQSVLDEHTINVPQLFGGGPVTFTTTLAPGDEVAVTTGYLRAQGVQADLFTTVFGGVEPPEVSTITYTTTVTSRGPSVEYATEATALVVYGNVDIQVEQTVGTVAGSCATTKAIAVAAGTTVYYCVTIQKTGSLDISSYEIAAPALSTTANPTPPLVDGVQLTGQQTGLSREISAPFTNTVIVTAYTPEGVAVTDQATTFAQPGSVATELAYTVGTAPDACATTTAITVVSGTTVYYCIRLKNVGTLPLEQHAITTRINDTQVLLDTVYTQTLAVGQTMVLTQAFNGQLGKLVTINETNAVTVVSTAPNGIAAEQSATASITLGALSITMDKYARTDTNNCVNNEPLRITTDREFYYCVVIRNTGAVPINSLNISEPSLNINFTVNQLLGAGQTITLTNASLAALNLNQALGPFRTTGSINPTMIVTAGTMAGATTQASRAFSISAVAPTFTPSPVPTATFTPIPSATPIPTATPTVPPTPTPTNVVPSILPTPTDPFALDSIEAPSPTADPAGGNAFDSALQSPLETPTATPTIDFVATDVAATAIAVDATAQAAAIATQDAIAMVNATATAQLLADAATQTAVALIPTATDTPLPTNTPTASPTTTPTFTPTPTEASAAILLPPAGTRIAPSTGGLRTGGGAVDYFTLLATTIATTTVTLGWIWFLAGSVIFFAVAGMFAGLSFRQQSDQRYQMQRTEADATLAQLDPPLDAFDNDMLAEPGTGAGATRRAAGASNDPTDEDYWPASLR